PDLRARAPSHLPADLRPLHAGTAVGLGHHPRHRGAGVTFHSTVIPALSRDPLGSRSAAEEWTLARTALGRDDVRREDGGDYTLVSVTSTLCTAELSADRKSTRL